MPATATIKRARAAGALGVSVPTAERWWTFARAWLYAELEDEVPHRPGVAAT